MALTRKLLKGMGLTDEQVDTIIEAHTETVDGLKETVSKYKSDAERLSDVQKELDELKSKDDDGFEEKYAKVKKEFDEFKADITAKETKAAKLKASREYYESKNITGENLELAIKASEKEIDALELDGDKIKDTSVLDGLISGTFARLVSSTSVQGMQMPHPPMNTGGKTVSKDDIYKKDENGRYLMSASERQKALIENSLI